MTFCVSKLVQIKSTTFKKEKSLAVYWLLFRGDKKLTSAVIDKFIWSDSQFIFFTLNQCIF